MKVVKRTGSFTLLAALLVGCSSGGAPAAERVATESTPTPITTVTTTTPPTMTMAEMSSEAREALVRCWDALHPFLAESAALGGDDLDVAQVACHEAGVQLFVNGADEPRAVVVEVVAMLNLAQVDLILDEFDVATVQADVDRLSAALAVYVVG
jgi:hypothetical protein